MREWSGLRILQAPLGTAKSKWRRNRDRAWSEARTLRTADGGIGMQLSRDFAAGLDASAAEIHKKRSSGGPMSADRS